MDHSVQCQWSSQPAGSVTMRRRARLLWHKFYCSEFASMILVDIEEWSHDNTVGKFATGKTQLRSLALCHAAELHKDLHTSTHIDIHASIGDHAFACSETSGLLSAIDWSAPAGWHGPRWRVWHTAACCVATVDLRVLGLFRKMDNSCWGLLHGKNRQSLVGFQSSDVLRFLLPVRHWAKNSVPLNLKIVLYLEKKLKSFLFGLPFCLWQRVHWLCSAI